MGYFSLFFRCPTASVGASFHGALRNRTQCREFPLRLSIGHLHLLPVISELSLCGPPCSIVTARATFILLQIWSFTRVLSISMLTYSDGIFWSSGRHIHQRPHFVLHTVPFSRARHGRYPPSSSLLGGVLGTDENES